MTCTSSPSTQQCVYVCDNFHDLGVAPCSAALASSDVGSSCRRGARELWSKALYFVTALVCAVDTIFIVQRRDGDVMISPFAGPDRPEEATHDVAQQVTVAHHSQRCRQPKAVTRHWQYYDNISAIWFIPHLTSSPGLHVNAAYAAQSIPIARIDHCTTERMSPI